MSHLAFEVMDFVRRALKNPQLAADPDTLARLQQFARNAWDGAFVALTAPMAPETWEAIGTLLGAEEQSQAVPLTFPKPIEVLGFYPSIRANLAVGPHPTNDDVQVQITVNRKEVITTRNEQQSTNANDRGFVTAGAMGILTPRLVGLRIETPRPELGFTWRWRAGAGVWGDSTPGMAVIARYI